MQEDDLVPVVDVHQAAFPGFFLEQMGPAFLKIYYRLVLEYEGSIAKVYTSEIGIVEGFVVGFVKPGAFYKHFVLSAPRLFLPIAYGVISNPRLLINVFENFFRLVTSEREYSKFLIDKHTAELASIAVAGSARGVGSSLIKAFIESAWGLQLTTVTLTTNYDNNEPVKQFYLKHGFINAGTEIRKGRKMTRYLLKRAEG